MSGRSLTFFSLLGCLLYSPLSAQTAAPATPSAERVYTILPLGDSITEGSAAFANYRFPLWVKLKSAGYYVKYVGSKKSGTRVGEMAHEGYGGKTAEYLAEHIEKLYADNPADIVLLHAGHNYAAENNPVARIVAANERIIATVRKANPKVAILLAQVIPSGKLPKYSYIPELNQELARLGERLRTPESPVVVVNQAEGFDPEHDTVEDKVHPNPRGAEKMADRWFAALQTVLPALPRQIQPTLTTYKKGKDYELKLHVFRPEGESKPRPAIVFFFGGGWANGTPIQFYRECREMAADGMVAISADYRIAGVNKTSPYEAIADAVSAIRWVRQHAAKLGVDPQRIVAAGASAGGHIAVETALAKTFNEPDEDATISAVPNALVLYYPALNTGPDGHRAGAFKERYMDASPMHALVAKAPPTILFQGTADKITPAETAKAFYQKLQDFGGKAELHLYEGGGHPLFSYHLPPNATARDIMAKQKAFLIECGMMEKP